MYYCALYNAALVLHVYYTIYYILVCRVGLNLAAVDAFEYQNDVVKYLFSF